MIKNILFIDDEIVTLGMGKMMLESMGCNVVIAEGGIQGIELLKANDDIDLIFLDLMMPDLHGLKVLEYIKSDKRFKNTPIILQSGMNEPKDVERACKLGISGLLQKPYKRQGLEKALKEVDFL